MARHATTVEYNWLATEPQETDYYYGHHLAYLCTLYSESRSRYEDLKIDATASTQFASLVLFIVYLS